MTWKLDEQAASLFKRRPGSDPRGIAVLPGDYSIVLTYADVKDTTKVKVIPDPRFEVHPEVDQALYTFRKEVDAEVALLAKQLHTIDDKKAWVEKIDKLQKEKGIKEDDPLVISVQDMKIQLKELRAKGQIPRPDRQVGAWQSFETSPHSKLRAVMRTARAQTSLPSAQHKQMLQEASRSITAYSKEVDTFIETNWQPFEAAVKKSGLDE